VQDKAGAAATWPCTPTGGWNELVTLLKGVQPDSIKIQINMRVDKVCLSHGPLPPPPPPPPPAPLLPNCPRPPGAVKRSLVFLSIFS
jgi:hypothetical protein